MTSKEIFNRYTAMLHDKLTNIPGIKTEELRTFTEECDKVNSCWVSEKEILHVFEVYWNINQNAFQRRNHEHS